jgi:hypothetical protein
VLKSFEKENTRTCDQLAFRRYTRPCSPPSSASFLKYNSVLIKNPHSKEPKMFIVYLESPIGGTP